MLGARQIKAETDGGAFVYTGDFSLHDSYTTRGAKIVDCDTLMIDSTYAQPHMRFPSRFDVLAAMEKFVKKNSDSIIVFGAYNSGKAQELVSFLNRECGVAPVVNEKAAAFCSRYEKCGVRLDYFTSGSGEAEEAMRHPFVSIMPHFQVNFNFGSKLSQAHGRRVKTAVATGWAALSRFPVDEAFPLSDHADFSETMHYINNCKAKTVVCANSGAQEAAAALKKQGVNAITRDEAEQGFQMMLA
jgi:Cft2 family RNA processing exonuclease